MTKLLYHNKYLSLTCSSCNTGTCALPDMYALSPWASDIHIRQSTVPVLQAFLDIDQDSR